MRVALCLLATFLFALSARAQNTIHVKGRVLGESGQPVAKATVQVKGATTAVSSDDKGEFEVVAPSDGTLIISSIGYVTNTIRISGRPSIEIVLSAAVNNLDQVVVVGYGTQRRKDVTGSIVSIKEEELRSVPTPNLQGALQGKAAGVEVQTVGTTPGSSAQIRIRGIRSISGSNDPLLVVDGIPFDGQLNDINPDDLASVDVLKDASATAIYGSRGANGVLLITTKRGRIGPTHVTYSGYYGISTVEKKYPVFNAQQYQAMRNISPWAQGYQPLELASIAAGKSTDWQNLMYSNAHKTDQNITVSGGNDGSTFSLGGGYYNETSVLPGQDFTRYSVRGTIDTRIGSRIKVGLSTLNTVTVTHGSQFVNAMFPILALSPLMPAYNADGTILRNPDGDNDDLLTQYSPLLLKHNNNVWADQVTRVRTINSLYGELEIIKGLKYRANLGLNYATEEDDQFQAQDDTTKGGQPDYFRPLQASMGYVNNYSSYGYTIENLLTYDKTFGKSKISFTGLYSFQQFRSHNTSIQKDSITASFTQFYDLALSNVNHAAVLGGGESSWALISYMARLNYSFDDRFLLTLTARDDGSSRLAAGHKFHQYPAISAGWNILNENFMKNVNFLTNLKLRAGYGQTSNQAVNPYASLGLVSNSNGIASPANVIRYNYGPQIVTGYNIVTLPNPNLDWEYTKTINLGIDFGFLHNRITGSIDYYHQRTNRILYSVTLPASSGVSGAYTTNVGQMSNWGPELQVSTVNIQSQGRGHFTWTTDFNLFFNKNKLLALSTGVSKDIANQLFVGYSMTSIYDYKKVGIWQTSQAAQAAQYGSVPGQIHLADLGGPNGKPDGVISQDYDRMVIGNQDAKLEGGMTNRFTYGPLDFSFVLYARFGGLLISQIHQPLSSYLTVMDGKRSGLKVDYWTPTNPSNWFPEPSASISPVSTAWTTLGYYSGTFVQLRSINLGYTFSANLLRSLKAQSIRFYAVVDNVGYFFSPYLNQTGINPVSTNQGNNGVSSPGNIRSNTNGNGSLTVSAGTPQNRTFSIGANISF